MRKGERLLELKKLIIKNFTQSNWQDIGLLTDSLEHIADHPRLFRSMDFGDDDYEEHAGYVLLELVKGGYLPTIEEYVSVKFGDDSEYVSSQPSERRITFAPVAFSIPDFDPREDLVAVMMPFKAEFTPVYKAIKRACSDASLACLRADDIWKESVFIQDIFKLILEARIVICDFSGRNSNVMYETGIAHTLGKEVVPVSQSIESIPSDLQHHRACLYHPNPEGLRTLRGKLVVRLRSIVGGDDENEEEDDLS